MSMGIFNLLIPKEKIVGIEISSQKLRMLYLELDRNNIAIVKGKSEVDLEEGTIISNVIINKKKLSKAINKLKNNFQPKKFLSPFAIVTISQSGIYSEVVELPKSLNNEQIMGAISLKAAESLPLPLSECFMDWQIIDRGGFKNKISVSLISKQIAQDYIEVLKENGFNLIALEAPFLSVERAINIPKDPIILLLLKNDGITSIIYNKKFSYFSQFESWQELSPEKEIKNISDLNRTIKKKIKTLSSYFENQYHPLKISRIVLISDRFNSDAIIKEIGKANLLAEEARIKIKALDSNEWMLAAGAAARAFIPRSDDTITSLLPIGTESLYEKQKALSFSKSMRLLIFSLSLFYLIIFTTAYLYVSYLEENIAKQISMRNSLPLSEEYLKMETDTKEFNNYVKDIKKINDSTTSGHSVVLKNISSVNAPGILLTNMNFSDPLKPISINGIASTRENLNTFKYKMENSPLFKNVKFSIKNIAQKDNIIFSVSLYSN